MKVVDFLMKDIDLLVEIVELLVEIVELSHQFLSDIVPKVTDFEDYDVSATK